ncbi:MAG: pentapeptide repeat-containing protein [Chlorobiaceae bacterium]|nr:pentapeptide repeat-containing protein [Chlorobiaceae bacterium]NTV15945.1 pentapeptide repeat-containing protein [Chlorobiaceae bacterium]
MADSEQLHLLNEGVTVWNQWRLEHPEIHPDLHDASLISRDLRGANLSEATLGGANLSKTNLAGANLAEADLRNADLRGANLSKTNLTGVNFSKSTIDIFTTYHDVQGCDIGVNGLYSPVTDSAALLRIDPPGNSMQGANADAVIESLRHARKLHTFSLLLAGIALLFIVIKPKTITLPYLAGSFKFDDISYSFLAMILSTVLLSQVSSFIDSALQGARYLNDRRSAMLVGHFPWLLSKYESEQANRRQSKMMRFFLVFHPVIYLYFFMKWDVLFSGNWEELMLHYQEMPVIFAEYLLPVFYVILFKLCIHIFRLSEGFQKPILFDTETERGRHSDMERLAEALEKQASRTAELVELMRQREG